MKFLSHYLYRGDLLIAILALLPLAVEKRLAFDTFHAKDLALIFGLLSMSSFSVAALLSIRLPRIDHHFGGLVRIWTLHRALGFITLASAYLHVWFLALHGLGFSLSTSIQILFPTLNRAEIWSGWVSLVLLITFLAPSFKFFKNFDYQKWKKIHLLSIPAYFLALLHVYLLTNNKILWSLYGVSVLIAFSWRKILSKQFGRYQYSVHNIQKLADGVVELELEACEKKLKFSPGQFVYLTPYDSSLENGRKEEHPYTIASSCIDPQIKIAIKDLGDASKAIQSIKKNSFVTLEGPYGDFFKRRFPQKNQLWIAGGIGITPFISAFRSFRDGAALEQKITLLYLSKDKRRGYYSEELAEIASKNQSLEMINHYHQEIGFLNIDFLQANISDFHQREIYICGPDQMNGHVIKLLTKNGVSNRQIHSENFNLL